ncbi:hypothetical protein VNI00_014183 [Paramarasmius palmivorus]|uniref:Uncharacterized protein n=1 Tax=Paramarasmius palmivorus TaxID=297713 RepID=A0AAW0BYM3_9AGAR
MIVRPRVIAFLSSLALLALANPVFDFIASSFSRMDVPSTGTVNIPASAKWRIPSLPRGSFDKFQIVFVQDNPVITTSVVQMNFTPGQTEGMISFTPTRTGLDTSAQVGGDITITEPSPHESTTQAEARTSTNTILLTSQPFGPTSTTDSESTPVATYSSTTTVASSSPGILTPNPHGATRRSRLLGVILGTTLGLLFVLASIALYVRYQKSSNHLWIGVFFARKRVERTESISPYIHSAAEKSGSRKDRSNPVSNTPHIPESDGATAGRDEGENEEALGEESKIDEVVVYHDDSEWRTRLQAGRVRVLEMPPRYDSVWRES